MSIVNSKKIHEFIGKQAIFRDTLNKQINTGSEDPVNDRIEQLTDKKTYSSVSSDCIFSKSALTKAKSASKNSEISSQ